ncbi:unnamed protein product [Rodentolepis nana]|uniref:DUF5727 domain-containing protein n=1 Tax=Rodentolepis nana TaxID=102285 RepID=A0A0R3TCH3_RODNA|nr:unnamed protein product [Rodentolepis nana]
MTILLNQLFFIIYILCEYVESQEASGSRIVTTSRGPVGPLKFTMFGPPEGQVHRKSGKSDRFELNSNDNCHIFGTTIGRPCTFDKRSNTATLNFDDVSQYQYIEVTDGNYVYTVYFADDCLFPPPKSGDVLIPPLIPLYRYLKDETSVDLEFKIYDLPKSKTV